MFNDCANRKQHSNSFEASKRVEFLFRNEKYSHTLYTVDFVNVVLLEYTISNEFSSFQTMALWQANFLLLQSSSL